jgi:hypothetical protein
MDFSSLLGSAMNQQGGSRRQQPQMANPPTTDTLERLKQIAAMDQQRGLDSVSGPGAVQMAQQAPGYSFQYKSPGQPGMPPGQQYGVMAQDLEKTPAGRSVVQEGSDGVKRIDTPRLTMQNTAAIGELANRIDEQPLDKLRRYTQGYGQGY